MRRILYLKILLISILLTGCLNYTQITTIRSDNSGEMFIHYWAKWNSWQDTLVLSKIGIFEENAIQQEFKSKYTEIKRIEVFKDFSDSTLHTQIELNFNNFDSLNYTKVFKTSEFSILDGPDDTKIFSQFIPPFITGFGFDENNYFLEYIYYLPGKIISHNADDLSNNKLTWKFKIKDIKKGKIITATFRPFRLKETPLWIYILALIVFLIVIVFLFKKKSD